MSNVLMLLLFCILAILIGPLSVYAPILLSVNPILLVLLWKLFHPKEFPLLILLCWLLVIQIQTPLLPWGSLIILGIFVITLLQLVQRNYLEHRRLSSFVLLVALSSVLWDSLALVATTIWAYSAGLPTPWMGSVAIEKIILLDALGMTIFLCALVGIESRLHQEAIADTLRRYYEHLHRPHFRSSNAAIR